MTRLMTLQNGVIKKHRIMVLELLAIYFLSH